MSLAPAKVRVEIFREPKFFDDSFAKGWTQTSGVAAFDGETAIVYGYYAFGCAEKSLPNIVVATYQLLQVRVTEVTGSGTKWGVKVYDGSSWLDVFSNQSGVGVFESFIPATGNPLTKIALLEETVGDLSNYVVFDYVVICKGAMLIPDLGDLVEELTVTRPLLNNGIAGATLSIPNFAGAYNGLIKDHDVIIIWIARTEADLGNPYYKAFGGRIEDLINRGDGYGAFYIDLDCHGHAYELDIPPALLQASYSATNGRTIIEAALALCTYLAKHPIAAKWFDNAGSSGSTDDRINSTHDVLYDEEVPMTVIQEILEKAKNPAAVQGFDVYETPAGCLIGRLRNSLDSEWEGALTPRAYQKSMDLHRVRNKIKVDGCKDHALPADKDLWTDSTGYWTVGSGTLYANGATKIVGSYSMSLQGDNCYMYRVFTAISGGTRYRRSYGNLIFWTGEDNGKEIEVRLYAPDASNYFSRKISGVYKWTQEVWGLGVGHDLEWTKVGSADWDNIQGFRIGVNGTTNVTLWLDGLHFWPNRFSATAEDATSEGAYGIRCSKPEVDDSLKSDAECLARGESILAILKDPIITLSDVVLDGDYWMEPSLRAQIVVANDGLDAEFRIVQVKYIVKGTQWDAVLTLSNEPQMVDYVFKLVQEAQKLLERRS